MMKLGGRVMGSMSLPSSTVTRKPVPDKFPAGLRVLVVDDDPTCLTILEKMLRTCKYVVSKTNRAEVALNLLRENQDGFDVVLSDVHMPDMDGFKLLEHVGLEMDLPVIMMSADDSNHVVMKGVTHGACDYLIKPVRIEALKNIWQHVIRKKKKKKNEWKEAEQSSSWDEGDRRQKQDDAVSSPANEGSWKSSKRKSEDEDPDEKDDTTTQKKPRVVWSVELHQQFVAAVNQLGIDKAVPKKILELMNVPGLTRENVASHLQKYRLYLKRLSEASQYQGGFDSSFMSQDSGLSAMSSISGMDLQALHATGQLSGQTLAAYTRLPLIGPSMSMPFIDQRNLFSFENSKPRYGDPQQQQPQSSNINKEMHLLHGIPTTMEPKQFAGNMTMLSNASTNHQSTSSMIKMGLQQSHGLMSNESIGVHANQPLIGQPIQSNGVGRTVLTRNGTSGLQGFNQEVNNLCFKAVDRYVGNYEMQINTTFGSSSQPSVSASSNVNAVPSVSVNQSRIAGNALAGKPMVTSRLDNQHMGMQNINHNVSSIVADDTSRGKPEKHSNIVSSGTNVFSEHYSQDDLMCTVLKQVRN